MVNKIDGARPERAQVLNRNNIRPRAPLPCLSCSCKIENTFKLREVQQKAQVERCNNIARRNSIVMVVVLFYNKSMLVVVQSILLFYNRALFSSDPYLYRAPTNV